LHLFFDIKRHKICSFSRWINIFGFLCPYAFAIPEGIFGAFFFLGAVLKKTLQYNKMQGKVIISAENRKGK